MKSVLKISLIIILIYATGCSNDDSNKITASGNIEIKETIVSAKVTGEVISILRDEGIRVNKGDTIIIIDHDNLDLQLAQAVASRQVAEAQLNLLKAGARSEDINQAENNLKQAGITLELAENDKDRMTDLYKSQAITKKQYEDVLAKYELSVSQFNTAKENLKKLKNLARPEEIKQSEANLERQIAAVNLLKKNIHDSYIQAPLNGYIVNMFIEEGETVSMLSSLFKVSNLDVAELVIYISEEKLGKVKLGQKSEVSTDTFKDKIYQGEVIYISPEAEFTPKNIQTEEERTKLVYAVKIRIPNPNQELKAGMPADATINLEAPSYSPQGGE
jgi:HlyD family secretion protein